MRGIGTAALGRGAAWVGLGALIAVGLLAAEPARAGDDFERGFKSELGRIAAHEAVSAGLQILGGILYPVYGSHGYGHPGYGQRGYGRYPRGYGHDRGLHRGHYKHRKPCGYGDYERYERHDGYGGYEQYERHSRYPYRGRVGYYDD